MTQQHLSQPKPRWLSRFLPTQGNVIFTLLAITLAFWAQNVGALPGASTSASPQQASSNTISYQGRLANSDGNPLTGQYDMEFRIYDVPTGGTPLWQEYWTGGNSVQVSDGLFNVMLGSIDNTLADAIASHDELYLGITVGTDSQISPRVQLGSVPFSMQALTVPDGSISSEKLANGAVTTAKLNVDNGLLVSGDITLTGTFDGSKSYWADYRSYIRFLKQDGVTAAHLCPEGGTAVGVVAPKQSLEWVTGDEICQHRWNSTEKACLNVHQIAPCGSINGNHYPYSAESCSSNFSGKWAPFYWWDAEPTHNVTHNILGQGIGCYPVKYACCTAP